MKKISRHTSRRLLASWAAAAVHLYLSATSVRAEEVLMGLGWSDYSDNASTDNEVLSLEYRTNAIRGLLGADLYAGVSTAIQRTGDYWIGAGPVLRWSLAHSWFADASVMLGYYDEARPENRLGGHLQFQSQIGIGYWLGDVDAISLVATHKSNAETNNVNPGANSLLLRWHHRF